tara:strand:+ start:477 stop:911 length:435 start_codon:yes stop_codon:yes gene_type:complete
MVIAVNVRIDDRRFKKYLTSLITRTKKGTKYFTEQMVDNIRDIYKAEAYDTGALSNSVSYLPGTRSATLLIGNSQTIRTEGTSYNINYAFPVEYGVTTGIGKTFLNPRTKKSQTVRSRTGIQAIERSQPIARLRTQRYVVNGKT